MTENNINELVSISQTIGKEIAYVQGGGGNTSIKLDSTRMAIKASGGFLKEMTHCAGYSVVNYTAIRDYLNHPDTDETIFTQKIKSYVVETENRPSIETGFHALLGFCVIHTHSVYANLLTCSDEGKQIVQMLFPDALWVDYTTPGRALTLSIQEALKIEKIAPNIIFLQNHGLITTGDTTQKTIKLHHNVNKKIMSYFNIAQALYSSNEQDIVRDFIKSHVLFPDQVVYTMAGETIAETTAGKETLWTYRYILNMLKEKKLTPHYLSQHKVDILLNMESEKYRQKVLSQ